jgi:hypothetical protein
MAPVSVVLATDCAETCRLQWIERFARACTESAFLLGVITPARCAACTAESRPSERPFVPAQTPVYHCVASLHLHAASGPWQKTINIE